MTLPDCRARRELSIDVLYVTRASNYVELWMEQLLYRFLVPVSNFVDIFFVMLISSYQRTSTDFFAFGVYMHTTPYHTLPYHAILHGYISFVFQSTNYTTLGPKFYAKLVSAITRRGSKLWWRTAHQSKALGDIYNLAVPKRDLKHFSKSDLPGFAGGAFNDSEILFNDFEMCVLMILKCCLMILKCFVYDLEKLFNDFEMLF